jgi:DNA primase
MQYPKDVLEGIRERVDLRQIYPQGLIRERNHDRKWLKALCQFHDDSSPSMGVSQYGFCCKAASCGVRGDVFYYVQLAEGVDFPTAVKILAERTALTPYIAPERARVKIVKAAEFSWDEIGKFKKSMTDSDYEYLETEKMIPRWASESLNIGSLPLVQSEQSGLYTIPITVERADKVEDIKIYNPHRKYERAKYYHLKSGVCIHLAFLSNLSEGDDEVYLMAGEHDYAVAFSQGLPALTTTGGESTWKPEWTSQLERFKHIWVVYDNDEAGWKGANKIMQHIPSAHRINLGLLSDARVKDFADLVKAGYDLDDFMKLQKECLRRYG